MDRAHSSKSIAAPAFLAVDFFCGAGGTTRGLIDAGGYVMAGIDKDDRCKTTYAENNINTAVDYASSRFLNFDVFPRDEEYEAGQQDELIAKLDDLIGYYKRKAPKVPLLFAICAPCQPFTRLSRKKLSDKRKKGREKDRNLLAQAAVYVERYMPEMVLSENVSGIKDPKYGGIWEAFRQHLDTLGYVTGSKVVCTSKFGVPQFRKRSILIAVRRELVREERFADMLESELLVPESDPNAMVVTVADAIGHMPPIKAGETHIDIPNHRARTLSELNLKRLSSAKPGQSNAYMATTEFGDLTLDCHRKVNERLNNKCFTDVYTRMHPDRPSPTITTKCHSISNGRFGHYDMSQNRGMSLREAAILQSFPDDYVFYPTDQIEPVARMIGNAVPPRLAKYFAGYLVSSIDGAHAR
ncbi:DNA cytosine methyltransferase [Mesorhizobium sp. NZP2234]|uniref:DNA cytosine methyltransferase n=1 Tax=Mesorhizobium sp. NZP2234 TaxID=2483402 RepID=UPI0015532111|nr:DNA cytosine methyltransferase [Mesorhizobium sp. NZP2234]QKC89476.1 DNA cytosine methyltransferase [Mesorhizobium sp. NZP2234]